MLPSSVFSALFFFFFRPPLSLSSWWMCVPSGGSLSSDARLKGMFIKIYNCHSPPTVTQATVYVSRSFFIPAVNTELLQSAVHMPARARVWASADVRGRACVRLCQGEGKKKKKTQPPELPPLGPTSPPGHFGSAVNSRFFFWFFLPNSNRLSALAWGSVHLLTRCLLPACSLTKVHCVTLKDKAWGSSYDL